MNKTKKKTNSNAELNTMECIEYTKSKMRWSVTLFFVSRFDIFILDLDSNTTLLANTYHTKYRKHVEMGSSNNN